LHSKPNVFARVPKYKSLWQTPNERGLPIGNLTSQFFANVYLNELDQFVKHELRAKYYYRYVDDFVIFNDSPIILNEFFDRINIFVKERLQLQLHPFKKRLGVVNQGVDFVGYMHKPFRRYARKRTVNRLQSRVNQWKKSSNLFDEDALIRLRNSANSYYGLIRHTASYNLRKDIGQQVHSLFIRSDEKYKKLVIF
jgi:hypothetical protein